MSERDATVTWREKRRGGGRRCWSSFMLNKARMGDRLGTTSQAEAGMLPFVHRGSLRREGRGGEDGCLNNPPSEGEKYAGVRCGCVCAA